MKLKRFKTMADREKERMEKAQKDKERLDELTKKKMYELEEHDPTRKLICVLKQENFILKVQNAEMKKLLIEMGHPVARLLDREEVKVDGDYSFIFQKTNFLRGLTS